MAITFIHPPLRGRISGGNSYNGHIVQQAMATGAAIFSKELTGPLNQHCLESLPEQQLQIWDSLFWNELSLFTEYFQHRDAAILCHSLPSMNPLLNAVEHYKLQRLEQQAIMNMKLLIATGKGLSETLQQQYTDKPVFLCEPGVNPVYTALQRNRCVPQKTVQVLTVANLLPAKGYRELLGQFDALSEYSWCWHIVGDDDADPGFAARFRQEAMELDLLANINFHGVLKSSALAGLMAKCDLFVFASYYEAYGIVLAEAAANKIPVLSTRVGAAEQLFIDGRNGLLVEVGDWDYFGYCLRRLITDESWWRRLRFDTTQTPRTWLQCFAEFQQICTRYAKD